MNTTRIQNKGQVTIPTHLRNRVGLAKGDLVEFTYQRGKLVITPKSIIDRSGFPNANDEYTPEQRRQIDARLAQADEDIKAGRTFGPFETAEEAVAHMKAQLKQDKLPKKLKRAR